MNALFGLDGESQSVIYLARLGKAHTTEPNKKRLLQPLSGVPSVRQRRGLARFLGATV